MKDVDRQALAAALADAGRILDEAVDQLATDQTGVTALETNELLLLRSEAKQSIGRLQGMAMALRILNPGAAMSTLTAYLAARDRKADVERQLRDAKADLDLLERCLLDEFATEGVRSKTDATTGISVWINRRIWARAMNPDDRAATAQALQAHGGDLADFARLDFNVNSLSSYFRELAQQRSDDHDPVTDLAALVPDDLRLYIALTEDHTLSARKGST